MARELRIGGVSGHITSYVYVRANGINGNIPPHMPIVTPGVLWNMFMAEKRRCTSSWVRKVIARSCFRRFADVVIVGERQFVDFAVLINPSLSYMPKLPWLSIT